jgi:hypothetical protein
MVRHATRVANLFARPRQASAQCAAPLAQLMKVLGHEGKSLCAALNGRDDG